MAALGLALVSGHYFRGGVSWVGRKRLNNRDRGFYKYEKINNSKAMITKSAAEASYEE
tara:strand:- start:49 stop:222 length:174 start_codon:yes stop_codon:yes gene_type:complete